ncbi:F-box/kelch-repeat protein At3g23880-like [Lotus japonicus]|uniref:F-box/kelch-repeat protein At3g23880-like n=1 Tax=Lotus japonicus TaxID=34305 RepID=UPI002584777E|nr:F-box/kelch-repeat protein At3g23880-like [Lotus japonicus]
MKTAEFVPVLLWELLVEILSWLLVKTLMQFRCVCKSWKSLISNDKAFEKLHLHISAKNKHVLVTLREPDYDVEDEDHYLIMCPVRRFVEDPSFMIDEEGSCTLKGEYNIVGSCNDLVCFHLIDSNFRTGEFWVRLWNPITRLWSNKSPTFDIDNRVSFGFDYDDLRDTYKVVGLSDYFCWRGWKLVTMVYCMGDSCWRNIQGDPGFRLSLKQNYGQFVGGCLNWLAYDDSNHHCNHQNHHTDLERFVIVSFDMRKETYSSLSLPEVISEVSNIEIELSVFENCLCLFQDCKRIHFDVWQMREYGVRESWTRLVTLSYEHLQCDVYMFYPLPLMCLSEDGDILMLFENQNRDVILYNLRDNSEKHIQLPDNKRWLNANSYVQSLV